MRGSLAALINKKCASCIKFDTDKACDDDQLEKF